MKLLNKQTNEKKIYYKIYLIIMIFLHQIKKFFLNWYLINNTINIINKYY